MFANCGIIHFKMSQIDEQTAVAARAVEILIGNTRHQQQ